MAQGRDAAYATASKVMVDNLALRDGQEGIRAFIEKRKPVWSHKAEKAHDWLKRMHLESPPQQRSVDYSHLDQMVSVTSVE